MKFDYNSFITGLQKKFDGVFTDAEIRELLNLEAEINKDTPLSTGKRLEVNYVSFSGKKITEEEQEFSDDIIEYSQEIYSGVNMWVADNLKGKSSIFKIIKFALTGDNSLKANISKWIDQILVVFSINEKKYTVHIDNTKTRINAALYNKEIRVYPKDDDHKEEQVFLSSSKDDFQNQLKEFFFHQFDYYSLRWTQKSSVKDNDDLYEAGASWLTYFKSIFLESKDTADLMYGAQGTKVFQMLLGLHLTSPINKLSIEKDKMMHLKGKQQSYATREVTDNADKKNELQGSLDDVNKQLEALIQLEKQTVDTSEMIVQYEKVLGELDAQNAKIFQLNNDIQENRKQKNQTERRKQFVDDELNNLKKELYKAEKQQIDIKEYLEIGVFFSNLDLKTCPSCSHPVSSEKKEHAVTAHTCALCSDDVSKDVAEVNTDNLTAKSAELLQLQEGLKLSIDAFKQELEDLRKNSNDLYSANIKLEQQQHTVTDTGALNIRLQELQDAINEERKKVNPRTAEKNDLIEKKAVLNFRIKQLEEQPEKTGDQKIEKKIQLLERAIEELNKIRFAEGQSILKKLSELMTDEVKALGLKISEITISDRFDIKYKQDGDYLSFSEIAEGEQLRAKLAFYLSLIQLDIEHNYGRHSRFLIIDSPGKEEADKNYLDGLTKLIKELETRFGDKLQILIGTAERGLENTVKHQNVFPTDAYVF
jgi:hypothetical protein